jgi:ADP-ribose pyrophosphatase
MSTSREIYRGKIVHLFVDDIQLPNGRPATLEVIRHVGAAAALPFLSNTEVLLVRQYRHAAGGWLIEIPAGKLDDGELPEICARREVEEEVGFRPGRLEKLAAILTTPGFTDEVIHLYEAHDLVEATASLEDDEVLEPMRVPFDEAVAMVERGEIRDAKSVCAILLAKARRNSR